jgi:hypothetical protein
LGGVKVPGRGRRSERSRHELLAAGEAVDLPCRLRRTSARGWSPWIEGQLKLPASGATGEVATFVADTPAQQALVTGRAGRTGPLALQAPMRVSRRPVRFKTEAFYGMDAPVLVLVGDPDRQGSAAHTEIALPGPEVDAVVDRLIAIGISTGV